VLGLRTATGNHRPSVGMTVFPADVAREWLRVAGCAA
jgi:hypothetical protein